MELKPLKVSEVNNYIKKIIGTDPILNNIKVEGEISNFKHHYSGHMYFTLKDNTSRLRCIIFNRDNKNLKMKLEDGMKITAKGYISIYQRDGCYQLYIKEIKSDGIGDLYLKFEELKKRLKEEGYFDENKKKKIYRYPKKIGVVTSSTGAAVRDIITVTKRRYPIAEIIVYPVLVQGINSHTQICEGIKYFNNREDIDTLIIGRGGGSIEELWAFNEEDVAMGIYNSRVPVISAVGHETDFTISDFVSDLRAPTPSAAGELAVENLEYITKELSDRYYNVVNSMNRLLSYKRDILRNYRQTKLFNEPLYYIDQYKQRLDFQFRGLTRSIENNLVTKENTLQNRLENLKRLNPMSIIERGYTFVEDTEGKIIKTSSEVKKNQNIILNFKDGKVKVKAIDKICSRKEK